VRQPHPPLPPRPALPPSARLEAAPDPVRVRAAFVSDDDIRAMTIAYTTGISAGLPALTAGEAA
jgi:DNA segregation ATPase FtsK/SpoIIIE, S-DNA-T family